jgi:predicted ArsR family transcriptional regulator
MLDELLRAIDRSGTISIAELARRTGIGEPLVRQALRDLESRGYLESGIGDSKLDGCAPACAGCPVLPKCFSAVWQLTDKSRKYLAGSPIE